jgi:hypothetical protein
VHPGPPRQQFGGSPWPPQRAAARPEDAAVATFPGQVVPLDSLFGLGSNTPLDLLKIIRLGRFHRMTHGAKFLFGGKILRVVLIIFAWLLVTHWNAAQRVATALPPA